MHDEYVHKRKTGNTGNLAICILAMLSLIGGGMVYVAFRSISLRMFGWFENLGLMGPVDMIRSAGAGISPGEFVLFNLPDLLWMTSYLLFVNALIPKGSRCSYLFWSVSMPLLAVIHEILQGLGIASGSFDWIDLMCYIIPSGINLITYYYGQIKKRNPKIRYQQTPKFNHQLNTVNL